MHTKKSLNQKCKLKQAFYSTLQQGITKTQNNLKHYN